MASGSTVPVVLRVKRKREEEPAGALVAKIAKLDPSVCSNDADHRVFHLISTSQHHHQTDQEVLAHISKHRKHSSLSKLNTFSGLSISDKQEERRKERKALISTRRFKLVSQLRSLEDDEYKEPDSHAKRRHVEDDSAALHLGKGHVQLYDLEQEVLESSTASATLDHPRGMQDERTTNLGQEVMGSGSDDGRSESAITCNSTPMVREKLSGPSDFVYDLYYTNLCSIQEMNACNWSSIHAHSYEPELVHDLADSDEECYDDEEDSNDEGNWRNDYPDEKSSDGISSDDSDDNAAEGVGFREAYLGYGDDGSEGEDRPGHLDGSYW